MQTFTSRAITFVFLALMMSLTQAQDSLQRALGQNSSLEFLPVEEAYQYQLSLQDDELTVEWLIEPGYYLYKHRFAVQSANGNPLEWSIEPGLEKTDEYFGDVEVYYQFTTQRIPLAQFPADTDSIITFSYQGCADAGLCYPPETFAAQWRPSDRSFTVTAIPNRTNTSSNSSPASSISWLSAVLFALLGGMILNLMPCVFPILSLKALSLLQRHESHPINHGLAYSAGVIISFIGIAAILIALRQAGVAVGWGFQLQSPIFVAVLAYVFFALALNLAGFFEIHMSVGAGDSLTRGQGLGASFATGVLATVVASPCTAPFMGTALAFALTQTNAVALSVFAALGAGLALPFLALTAFPKLAEKLPQPGQWMVTLKELLAFPLLITCVWLVWIISNQAGSDGAAMILLGLIAIAFAIWLWRAGSWRKYVAMASLAAAVAMLFSPYMDTQTNRRDSFNFSEARIEQELAAGRSVFVNITADWCITCLVNERNALGDDEVEALFSRGDVVYLKGDWTRPDPIITAFLNKHQRDGVPLYVAYHQNRVEVLPQILSASMVLDAFGE